MRAIAAALRRCQEERRSCVCATIIRVEGSAYRREGARCLIHADGRITGILSGGCLEADIREQAHTVFASGVPKRLAYDLHDVEDEPWGLGAGCNGSVTVWLELFDPVSLPDTASAMLADGEERLTAKAEYWALMVLADRSGRYAPGTRWRQSCDALRGEHGGCKASGSVTAELGLPESGDGICAVIIDGQPVEVFAEYIRPQPRLYIIGAGADAELLSRVAAILDWPATIVYHRTTQAEPSRFPAADRVHHVPRADFSSLAALPGGYAVVMTHQLELDQEAVRQLLPMEGIVYVGVLGSRSRIRRIVTPAVAAEGFRAEWLHKLHAPIGLDIGGGTPEAISLSILAELVAHRNGRSGGRLRDLGMLEEAAGRAGSARREGVREGQRQVSREADDGAAPL
ncbi:XdhC family protein [Paenibacillus sp. 1P07SE]|uniref:XdhC family protein n=1 Tax=Paenibacillus sp. 1P07SE TaxID=3132209 RepID=UPI0039A497B8